MRLKFLVSALTAILFLSGSTAVWAQGAKGKRKESKEVVPDSINRQFQWEEKVVGPKDKGIDHQKIAAMQEQARREDAAKKKEPQQPKKAARAEGVDAPASATLPTMDIEKPAPVASKRPVKKAAYQEPPRQRDAIDNLLAEEMPAKSDAASGRSGLGSVLASNDGPSRRTASSSHAKKTKRGHHRGRRN
jgi:hypothetical protein